MQTTTEIQLVPSKVPHLKQVMSRIVNLGKG